MSIKVEHANFISIKIQDAADDVLSIEPMGAMDTLCFQLERTSPSCHLSKDDVKELIPLLQVWCDNE
jgi:hypothetical protein